MSMSRKAFAAMQRLCAAQVAAVGESPMLLTDGELNIYRAAFKAGFRSALSWQEQEREAVISAVERVIGRDDVDE